MYDIFGFVGRVGGVEEEERVFWVDGYGGVVWGLFFNFFVLLEIVIFGYGDVGVGVFVYKYVVDIGVLFESFIDNFFCFN